MGQLSILARLGRYDATVRSKIAKEEIDEILETTYFDEDEVFRMLDRFIELDPEKQSFSISVNKFKKLREFEFNPFTDLILNAIEIYKKIYIYLVEKNSEFKKIFEKKEGGLADVEEVSEGEDEDEEEEDDDEQDEDVEGMSKDAINQDAQSKEPKENEAQNIEYFLSIENPELEKNTLEIINFTLFCRILNELHIKGSQESKLKMAFKIFSIQTDQTIDIEDLKKVLKILFRGYQSPNKDLEINIENLAWNVMMEFSTDPTYKINFNNFQKIILSSNFLNNLVFIP